ncbi:TfoX-like protein [Motilibacter rhizosphaerae]|uniref:TfoX-like protein n=1 Tax=Motilibacter rhizosphaerae TaxID=598652 RepID=A0A4Q7NSH1_9ACTN|nr:TfoX/Sxy family protein [Motilibacter rhizosphaerae]RZS87610.1 TfoX-like protein [Motilibacter rhizosphaerae]
MAYDEELAERVRALLSGRPVVEQRMFGGLAFLLRGHLAVAASGSGGLMVRVDPDRTAELLEEPGASEFEMGRRGAVRGWVRVTGEVLDDDAVLATWVGRGTACVEGLPEQAAVRRGAARPTPSRGARR